MPSHAVRQTEGLIARAPHFGTTLKGQLNSPAVLPPGRRRGVLSIIVLRKVLYGCRTWSEYSKGKGEVRLRTGHGSPEGE